MKSKLVFVFGVFPDGGLILRFEFVAHAVVRVSDLALLTGNARSFVSRMSSDILVGFRFAEQRGAKMTESLLVG